MHSSVERSINSIMTVTMGDNTSIATQSTGMSGETVVEQLETRLREWYREQTTRKNIENGNAEYNTPQPPPSADVFRPNRLLQCRRKQYYGEQNAPRESPPPKGIYFAGSKVEEDLVLPYLREQVASWSDELFVANSLWIEEDVTAGNGDVTLRGSTDPVIVQENGFPVFVTEIKSKRSFNGSPSVSPHHRAQLHAYMAGLSAKHDASVREGAILYVSREDLELEIMSVSFDDDFWSRVGEWMEKLTTDRMHNELPSAEPEHDWECRYCPYAARCGAHTESRVSDVGPEGFVPSIEYPLESVKHHLECYPGVGLTATVANQYPWLSEDYEVTLPFCSTCGEATTISPERSGTDSTPLCPTCAEEGDISELQLVVGGLEP